MGSVKPRDERTDYRGLLYSIVMADPWLYPFIYLIYSSQGATLDDLRSMTGLRTQLVKRALWWLLKSGVVEEAGGRYYVSRGFARHVEELRLSTCITGGVYIIQLGDAYIVVSLGEGRVSHWAVHRELYDKLLELERNAGASFTGREVSQALSIDVGTATRLVRLRELLRECWRQGG
ncbi:hypothetical protein [Desulfurococcus mucosus]|uniref:Uncharacterized protein n=1 Tax=Desulfurococcus mucosus (strain ATCC 35584 / DSM 2162 / JCM 9187 / O7/1) TaxID=765177 RepID=E8R775_DESM0|nr:hypothetical protein [Desulfurococcus mucosus]ADV65540.1 hypothetical protein Desmu_1244 [Desulfurococcus mucosus DSM 2162]